MNSGGGHLKGQIGVLGAECRELFIGHRGSVNVAGSQVPSSKSGTTPLYAHSALSLVLAMLEVIAS